MADYQNHAGATRPQNRGGRGRRKRGNRGSFRNDDRDRRENRENREPRESRAPKPTGFQKFLSVVTFGILGKPSPKSSQRPSAPGQPIRTPRVDSNSKPAGASSSSSSYSSRENRPPKAPPTSEEVTAERLYVGNLSYDASESDLFELFSGSGRVKNAEVVVNNRTQRSKGFAFVTMQSIDEAKKAVADLNGKDFMGRPLVVGGAKPLPPRDEREERAPRREREQRDEHSEESENHAEAV